MGGSVPVNVQAYKAKVPTPMARLGISAEGPRCLGVAEEPEFVAATGIVIDLQVFKRSPIEHTGV